MFASLGSSESLRDLRSRCESDVADVPWSLEGSLGSNRARPPFQHDGSPAPVPPRPGLRGDIARLFSPQGLVDGRPSLGRALERILTRPGPGAILLYRASHQLWVRHHTLAAELLWRLSYFLTGADIHPGAEIGGGLRLTHTTGVVIGRGVRIGANVTLLHEVTLGGSARGWFDGAYQDGYPTIGDDSVIMAGAKVLGPICVGRGCFVGANAILARDLPDGEAFTPGRELGALRRELEQVQRVVSRLKSSSEGPPR